MVAAREPACHDGVGMRRVVSLSFSGAHQRGEAPACVRSGARATGTLVPQRRGSRRGTLFERAGLGGLKPAHRPPYESILPRCANGAGGLAGVKVSLVSPPSPPPHPPPP